MTAFPIQVRRARLLGLTAALLAVSAAPAGAVPAVVDVRVEGRTQTLFEGPVRSDGGEIRSPSDTRRRTCDGRNNEANEQSGPTATRSAVEAMRIVGLDFDADWFPSFDDYYLTRFGPDRESPGDEEYWGILVNDAFTPVGGCQAAVKADDRVLWAYDAFHVRGFLKLAVAGDLGAAPRPTVLAVRDVPLTVRATRAYGSTDETFFPRAGVRVAPVATADNGVQQTDPTAPTTAVTDTDGTADVSFPTLGWHRLKADDGEGAIRSNRLDVCVVPAAGDPCNVPPPADTLVREAPPLPPEPVGPPTTDPPVGGTTAPTPEPTTAAPVIELPRFTTQGAARGLVGLRWRVIQNGVGVSSWSFASRAAGATRGRWVTRARGQAGTRALLRLPAGRTWTVRSTFIDRRGRPVSETVGDVLVPIDERARTVVRRGTWRRRSVGGAWRGAVSTGRRGSSLRVRLAAGRPVLVVRGVTKGTRIRVRSGRSSAVYRVDANPRSRSHEVLLPRRKHAGAVTIRVVAGEVDTDGVGVRP